MNELVMALQLALPAMRRAKAAILRSDSGWSRAPAPAWLVDPDAAAAISITGLGEAMASAEAALDTAGFPAPQPGSNEESEMKPYRQGDVPLVPYSGGRDGFEEVPIENGEIVLALGEATGHHHHLNFRFDGLDPGEARLFRDVQTGAQILQVGGGGATLLHEEHDPITLPPGDYLQLVQVEDDGEMIVQVAD